LVSTLGLTCNYTVDLIVHINIIQEFLSYIIEQLMKVAVIVIDVAGVRSIVAVFVQNSEGNPGINA
jgi:hypothetical protein